eukprot:2518843-Alexandrium_andersonii.AAC.1
MDLYPSDSSDSEDGSPTGEAPATMRPIIRRKMGPRPCLSTIPNIIRVLLPLLSLLPSLPNYSTVRDLDCVELFAGRQAITRAINSQQTTAVLQGCAIGLSCLV